MNESLEARDLEKEIWNDVSFQDGYKLGYLTALKDLEESLEVIVQKVDVHTMVHVSDLKSKINHLKKEV